MKQYNLTAITGSNGPMEIIHATSPAQTSASNFLRVLMLHGYTQNATSFHAKTRALHKALAKALPSHAVQFCYPTAPHRLKPGDFPDVGPSATADVGTKGATDLEAFGWWRRKYKGDVEPARKEDPAADVIYAGLEDSLTLLARICQDHGPFDGVIGFSQGAAAAAMLASLLEANGRQAAFPSAKFPSSQMPLKFALCYCGFRAPGARYQILYEPKIHLTPVLHVLGQVDVVVDDIRSQALVDACSHPDNQVIIHPGGHFVPSQKPWLDAAASFVKSQIEPDPDKSLQEVTTKDFEVPF